MKGWRRPPHALCVLCAVSTTLGLCTLAMSIHPLPPEHCTSFSHLSLQKSLDADSHPFRGQKTGTLFGYRPQSIPGISARHHVAPPGQRVHYANATDGSGSAAEPASEEGPTRNSPHSNPVFLSSLPLRLHHSPLHCFSTPSPIHPRLSHRHRPPASAPGLAGPLGWRLLLHNAPI